jgi:hypothetical protein
MNVFHVSAQQTKLEALSYPGVGQRMVEAIVGSVRREALTILRTAPYGELEPGKILTSLRFANDTGEVRFAFARALEAVHIHTPRGSLDLSGSCEMAQRLSRVAARAMGVHHAKTKNACIKDVMSLAAGDDHGQALSSSYDAFRRDEHHGAGYDCGNIERGSITTKHGVLILSSDKRSYRIGGLLGQQMDLDALSARARNSIPATPCSSGSMMDSRLPPLHEYLPPPSISEIDSVEATFSNVEIETMLKLLGVDERLGKVDLDRQSVCSLLRWAKKSRDRAQL